MAIAILLCYIKIVKVEGMAGGDGRGQEKKVTGISQAQDRGL